MGAGAEIIIPLACGAGAHIFPAQINQPLDQPVHFQSSYLS